MPPHGKKRNNYLHGSYPIQSRARAASKIGKPAVKQRTHGRHYALATVGPQSLASQVDGQVVFFNGHHYVEPVSYTWLEANRLIERLPAERPGGAQKIERTERGNQVLATWNERHGPIETEEC